MLDTITGKNVGLRLNVECLIAEDFLAKSIQLVSVGTISPTNDYSYIGFLPKSCRQSVLIYLGRVAKVSPLLLIAMCSSIWADP